MRALLFATVGLFCLAGPSKAEESRLQVGWYGACGFTPAMPFATVAAQEINPAAPRCCRVAFNTTPEKVVEACQAQATQRR